VGVIARQCMKAGPRKIRGVGLNDTEVVSDRDILMYVLANGNWIEPSKVLSLHCPGLNMKLILKYIVYKRNSPDFSTVLTVTMLVT